MFPSSLALRPCHLLLVRCRLLQSSRTVLSGFQPEGRRAFHTCHVDSIKKKEGEGLRFGWRKVDVPPHMKQVYSDSRSNMFIYIAQFLQPVCGALTVFPPFLLLFNIRLGSGEYGPLEAFVMTPTMTMLLSLYFALHVAVIHGFLRIWVTQMFVDEEEDIFLAVLPHLYIPFSTRQLLFEAGSVSLLPGLPESLSNSLFRADRCEADGKGINGKKLFLNKKSFMSPIYFHSMIDGTQNK